MEEAKFSGQVILLLDEVHRLDKPKQDFLLPHLESGQVILIGATTENPYISISPAIRSRTQIFELKSLTTQDVILALERAIADEKRGLGKEKIVIEEDALLHFARSTMGDVRGSLNALELAALSTKPDADGTIHITLDIAEECVQKKALVHDKNGDAHYDVISAFQKSIRGSDVDAAMHYLARLLEAGELLIACRRLMVCAYEDIGLGNPQAVARTVLAVQAAEKLGLPEARSPWPMPSSIWPFRRNPIRLILPWTALWRMCAPESPVTYRIACAMPITAGQISWAAELAISTLTISRITGSNTIFAGRAERSPLLRTRIDR